jgi:hypothetical protein
VSGMDEQAGMRFLSHPSEDEWEEYAFGRLAESRVTLVEEHLLACTSCQSTLERVDHMIHTMRSVCPCAIEPSKGLPFLERWIPFPIRPAIVSLSLGAVLFLTVDMAVVRFPRRPEKLPVAFVALASFRGESMAKAPAQRSLDLEISQSDIPAAAGYVVEVVTTSGDSAWKGTPEIAAGKLVSHLSKGLSKGSYWVRLSGSNAVLVREFGLRVD